MHLPPLNPSYYALFVEDLRTEMRLGVYAHEKKPQPVAINIAVIVKRLSAGDGIEAVVDYNHLRDTALDLADTQHFGLQETFCEALIETLRSRPGVHGILVETRKLAAFADITALGCQMSDIDAAALR